MDFQLWGGSVLLTPSSVLFKGQLYMNWSELVKGVFMFLIFIWSLNNEFSKQLPSELDKTV